MRVGSLFSGAGGLDLAALELFPNASMAWHAEIDPAASKVLAHHWPDVPNLGDVSQIEWTAVEPVDVLVGGYPCQPFSTNGKRKGTDDERHLWPFVREAIRDLRPRFTLLENVAGHRSLGFDRVLGDLAEDGFHVGWCSVRASDVGACHARERVLLMVSQEPVMPAGGLAAWGELPLLPTPRASDGSGGPNPLSCPARRDDVETRLIRCGGWGVAEAAVRRQEALSRPAPEPLAANERGNLRMPAEVSEWMMWWPKGWVTDPVIGLSRNDQLKICGNGVVPRQAAAGFRFLLGVAAGVAA